MKTNKNRDKQNANLKPAKPGEVKNPKGRPVGSKNRKKFFEELLNVRVVGKDLNGKIVELTAFEQIGVAIVSKAMDGDLSAAKEILDSVFGKMKNDVDLKLDADVKHSHVIDMTQWK